MEKKYILTIALTVVITAMITSGGTYLLLRNLDAEPQVEYVTQTEYLSETKYIEKEAEEESQKNILRPFSFVAPKDSIIQNNGDTFEIITLENFEEVMLETEDDRSFHIRLYSNLEGLNKEEFSQTIACEDSGDFKNPLVSDFIKFNSGATAYFTQQFCDFHYIDRYIYSGEGYGDEYFIVFTAGYRNENSLAQDEARAFAESIEANGIYERKSRTLQ